MTDVVRAPAIRDIFAEIRNVRQAWRGLRADERENVPLDLRLALTALMDVAEAHVASGKVGEVAGGRGGAGAGVDRAEPVVETGVDEILTDGSGGGGEHSIPPMTGDVAEEIARQEEGGAVYEEPTQTRTARVLKDSPQA